MKIKRPIRHGVQAREMIEVRLPSYNNNQMQRIKPAINSFLNSERSLENSKAELIFI